MKRLTITVLALSLMLFTSCNKDPVGEQPDNTNKSAVFSSEAIVMPEEWTVTNFPKLSYDGNALTVDVYREIDEDNDGNGWPDIEETSAYFSADGAFLSVGNNDISDASGKAFEARHDGRIVNTYSLNSGETLVYETLYTDYEVGCYVHLYDEKDAYVTTLYPADAFGYELHRDVNSLSGDVFTVTTMLSVPGVGENAPARYGILTTEGLAVYDASGSLSFKLDDGSTPSAVLDTDAGLLYLSENRQGVQSLRQIDTAVGRLGREITLPEELTAQTPGSASTKLLSGDGYDLYAYNGRGLYGVNFIDAAYNTASTLVIDWTLSDIAPSDIRSVCMIDEKTAAIVTQDAMDNSAESVLSLCRMIPADQVVPKTEIVLAKLTDEWMLQFAVRDFNKSSETHRIVIRDYTQYDREQKKLAFDTDLAAGEIPDCVLIGAASSCDTFASTYERAGVFTDLTPVLQADDDFKYDDLLGYITKPYQYYGAQYLFPIAPEQHLLFAHAEDFGEGGGVTYDDFLSVMEQHAAAGNAISSGNSLGDIVLPSAIQEHYDEKTAVCTFDDGTLSALYSRAGAIPTGKEALPGDIKAAELFRLGQVRLLETYGGFSSLYDFVKETVELGEDAVVIGYPTEDGVMCMGRVSGSYLAITETSTEKAACVDFLQTLIDIKREQTCQNLGSVTGYTFYHEDIERQLADYDGITIVVNGNYQSYVPDAEADTLPGVKFKITQEDADKFASMLDSIERRINENKQPSVIFWDEYYAMIDRPFDEFLKIVQSKISIYLSEQKD